MSFPTTGLIDDFNRANENPLANGWLGPIFVAEAQLQLTSNAVGPLVGDSYWGTAFDINQEVYATMAARPPAGSSIILYARISNPNNAAMNGYRIQWIAQAVDDIVRIHKMTNGSSSGGQIGPDFTISGGLSAGGKLGLELQRSAINAYYMQPAGSWTYLAGVSDSTYLNGGYIGAELTSATSGTIDDFSGGNVIPGPVAVPVREYPQQHFGPF